MATNFQFDSNQVAPVSFDALEPGWYNAHIIDSDVKPNSQGTGTYLSLQFEILDGPAKGRKVFQNYTMSHPNDQAVQIGRGQLSKLMKDLQYPVIQQHTGELHNKPVLIKLKKKPAEGEYEERNEIVSTKVYGSPVQLVTAVAGSSGAAPAAFGGFGGGAPAPAPGAPAAPTAGFTGFGAPAPAPAPAAPPAPAPAPAAPSAPAPQPTQPRQPPAGYEMNPSAAYTYEGYINGGWTDHQLIQHGHMRQIPAAAPPAPAAPAAPPTVAPPHGFQPAAQPWDGKEGATGAPAPDANWNASQPQPGAAAPAPPAPSGPTPPAEVTQAKAPWDKS